MSVIEKTKKFIKEYFKDDFSGHDYDHSIRVYTNVKKLITNYDINKENILLAALLHDVDDKKIVGEEYYKYLNTRNYLKSIGKDSDIELIISYIEEVSFSKAKPVTSLEASILQDADRLDAIGAIGIARTFSYGGNHNRTIAESVEHFYDKLLKLKDLMNTKEAKLIAKQRHLFLEEFLKQYNEEIN